MAREPVNKVPDRIVLNWLGSSATIGNSGDSDHGGEQTHHIRFSSPQHRWARRPCACCQLF